MTFAFSPPPRTVFSVTDIPFCFILGVLRKAGWEKATNERATMEKTNSALALDVAHVVTSRTKGGVFWLFTNDMLMLIVIESAALIFIFYRPFYSCPPTESHAK